MRLVYTKKTEQSTVLGADCSSLSNLSTSIHGPKMSRNERKFLKECLEKEHEFIIRRNVKKRLDEFLDALKVKMYKAGDTVFKYGDKGDILYIIAQGDVECISNEGVDFGTSSKGKILGQFGFFNNKTRSANAKAIKDCRIYYIDLKTYNDIMFTRVSEPNDLNKFNIFYNLSDDIKKQLYPKLQINEFYNTNDAIVKEGDIFNCVYLVTNGSITGTTNAKKSEIFIKNNHFGDVEIKNNATKFIGTYVATEPSTVIKIPLDLLKSMMPQIYESFKKGTGLDSNDIKVKELHNNALEKRKSTTISLKAQ